MHEDAGLSIIFLTERFGQRGGLLFKNTHGIEHRLADLHACFQCFRDGKGCPSRQQLVAVLPITPAGVDGDVRIALSLDIDQPHSRRDLVKRAYQHAGVLGTCCFQHIGLAGIAVEGV